MSFVHLCHYIKTKQREVKMMNREKETEKLINNFDKFSYYLNGKLERDIEENRKGQFVIKLKKEDGNPVENAVVMVKQLTHEFKFGASLFYLDQFKDEERRKKYKENFKNFKK